MDDHRDSKEKREFHSSSIGLFFKVDEMLHEERSPYQSISVFLNSTFGKVLFLDELVQTTDRDEFFYHEMLVHPALITHPQPKQVLIIGGGDGGALREVLRYAGVRRVVLVEIDERVLEAARKHFPWLGPALEDSRAELVVADGRDYVETAERCFDVVLVDSSDPVGPSRVLHERDFYTKVRALLNPNGIVAAQFGSPIYHADVLGLNFAALAETFKIAKIYLGPVPTYPGGLWSYVFLSDHISPRIILRDPAPGLKYFNADIHGSAFVLPNFIKNRL